MTPHDAQQAAEWLCQRALGESSPATWHARLYAIAGGARAASELDLGLLGMLRAAHAWLRSGDDVGGKRQAGRRVLCWAALCAEIEASTHEQQQRDQRASATATTPH